MDNKIFEFEKYRPFGDVIGDAFTFIFKNFKPVLSGFLVFVMPFILVGAGAQVFFGKELFSFYTSSLTLEEEPGLFSSLSMGIGLMIFYILIFLASIVLYAYIFALIDGYRKNGQAPDTNDLWDSVKLYFPKLFLFTLFLIGIIGLPVLMIVFGSMAITPVLGIFLVLILIPVMIYVYVPISLSPYIYIHEKLNIVLSIRRAFQLVRDKWWNTFGVIFILAMITGVISYIFIIPAYIAIFVVGFSAIDTGGLDPQIGIWAGIISLLMFLGVLFSSIYQLVGTVLQYYSLKEQKEGTSLMRRIDALDNNENQDLV